MRFGITMFATDVTTAGNAARVLAVDDQPSFLAVIGDVVCATSLLTLVAKAD